MNCSAFLFLLLCLAYPSISSQQSSSASSSSSSDTAQQPKTASDGASQSPPSHNQQRQHNKRAQQHQKQQQDTTTTPGVVELTSITLDSNIRNGSLWLIEFYAPWCSACNHFAGTYAKLAYTVHSTNSERERPVYIAKVNGDKERACTSRFNIQTYPSIFVVDGWHVYQYTGSRNEEALLNFVVREGYKNQHVRCCCCAVVVLLLCCCCAVVVLLLCCCAVVLLLCCCRASCFECCL